MATHDHTAFEADSQDPNGGGPLVAGHSETPGTLKDLYREFMAELRKDIDNPDSYERVNRIEAKIMAMPSITASDFAIKMLVMHCDGDLSCLPQDDPVWQEARLLAGGAA